MKKKYVIHPGFMNGDFYGYMDIIKHGDLNPNECLLFKSIRGIAGLEGMIHIYPSKEKRLNFKLREEKK